VAAGVADVAAGLVDLAAGGAQHLAIPVGIEHQGVPAVRARLPEVVQALQATALALPVADRILDEFQRGILAEVADREHRLEDRLQAGVFAFGGQAVHLEEALIRPLLDLDQVGYRDDRLDLREVDTLAVDVLGQALHARTNLRSDRGDRAGHDGRTTRAPRRGAKQTRGRGPLPPG
jgi:hypothetical protein